METNKRHPVDIQLCAYAGIQRLCNKERTNGLLQQDIDRLVKIYLDELVESSKDISRVFDAQDMKSLLTEAFEAGVDVGPDVIAEAKIECKRYVENKIKQICKQ